MKTASEKPMPSSLQTSQQESLTMSYEHAGAEAITTGLESGSLPDGDGLQDAARNLANSIAACRDIPREELLEHFTEIVASDFDEAEFAKAFSVVHVVFHDWMAG